MIAVDLFSGSGQATAAFRERGWGVIALDLDPGRRPDVVADVRKLPVRGRVDFLWASPPCTEFSDANARIPAIERRPSLECVFAVFEAVKELRPRFWILENVRGAIPFLGIPTMKIGPWCLWGYFPPIKVSAELQSFRKDTKRVRSSAARATVPLALSLAVFEAIERYWKFPRLLDMRSIRRHRHVAAPHGAASLFEASGLDDKLRAHGLKPENWK